MNFRGFAATKNFKLYFGHSAGANDAGERFVHAQTVQQVDVTRMQSPCRNLGRASSADALALVLGEVLHRVVAGAVDHLGRAAFSKRVADEPSREGWQTQNQWGGGSYRPPSRVLNTSYGWWFLRDVRRAKRNAALKITPSKRAQIAI